MPYIGFRVLTLCVLGSHRVALIAWTIEKKRHTSRPFVSNHHVVSSEQQSMLFSAPT